MKEATENTTRASAQRVPPVEVVLARSEDLVADEDLEAYARSVLGEDFDPLRGKVPGTTGSAG